VSPIFLTLLVIALTLIAFVREWASPDVLALSILCLLVPLGLIEMSDLAAVFSNEAPLTIAALFVIGGALERSGAVDHIGRMLKSRLSGKVRWAILSFTVVTAFFSAWMNNTAIVAILMPVTLGFARSKDIAASKLLIPLSYSSLLGGCCTLIGTSTNLLVNGALKSMNEPGMSMFELAPVGVPLTIAGIAYLTIFGARLLPNRSSITGTLEIEQRSSPLFHVLVGESSPLVGKKLFDTPLGDRAGGIHVMEIRRDGARVMLPLTAITIEPNDRFLIAPHRRRGGAAKTEQFFRDLGLSILSRVEGIVSELVVRDESSLIGRTLAKVDFRQTYNSVVLAVHRDSHNITDKLAELPLEVGDTLLVITAKNNLNALNATRDFVMTDLAEPVVNPNEPHRPLHVKLAWGVMIAVVLTAALTDMLSRANPSIPAIPIHYAALVGALVLLWTKVMSPREAYASIDWQVLLMLYGLLGLGIAMQNTGTAEWIAHKAVAFGESIVPRDKLPLFMLWLLFLITLVLTEVLSNNATAVMMIPIAITTAIHLDVNHRPFIIAITLAASMAFAMPMGYQTHMMVFGPGNYRFSDFLRVGIPMNLICWIGSCLLIPLIWPL
jgi:di/tricarboxylate transporter